MGLRGRRWVAGRPRPSLREVLGGAGGAAAASSLAQTGVILRSKSLKKSLPEYLARRAARQDRLDEWRRDRAELSAPYVQATDRRWTRRNGGPSGDDVAWALARHEESELRREVERGVLLAALQREQSDRALFDQVRFGPRGRR